MDCRSRQRALQYLRGDKHRIPHGAKRRRVGEIQAFNLSDGQPRLQRCRQRVDPDGRPVRPDNDKQIRIAGRSADGEKPIPVTPSPSQ